MFGYSLIRTKKLMAIYAKMAIFALEKVRQSKSATNGNTRENNNNPPAGERHE